MDIPSGVVSHVQLQGVTANEHHNQLHAAQHLLAGNDPLSVVFRQETRIVKTAVFTVTNTTTLADEPELQFAVLAGVKYLVEAHLNLSGLAVAGYKVGFVLAGGGNGRLHNANVGISTYLNATNAVFPTAVVINATADSIEYVHLFGVVTPTANDTLKLQFAQGTANASPSNLNTGSYAVLARF